ncbi:MAG: hypothetical protein ACT4QG_04940 [Sporichthyaceae bacterium]
MTTYALSESQLDRWTVMNVLGIVVIVAVVALLSLLVWLVAIIDRNVSEIGETLIAITENTAGHPIVGDTAAVVDSLLDEGLQHHGWLTRVVNAVEHPVSASS